VGDEQDIPIINGGMVRVVTVPGGFGMNAELFRYIEQKVVGYTARDNRPFVSNAAEYLEEDRLLEDDLDSIATLFLIGLWPSDTARFALRAPFFNVPFHKDRYACVRGELC
jgi:hypothetical protein